MVSFVYIGASRMDTSSHQVTLGLPNGQHVDLITQGANWFWGPFANGDGYAYGPFPTLAAASAHVLHTFSVPCPAFGAPTVVLILPLSHGLTAYATNGAHRPAVRLSKDTDLVTLSVSGAEDLRRLTECRNTALALR
jgi:hypothetical protein